MITNLLIFAGMCVGILIGIPALYWLNDNLDLRPLLRKLKIVAQKK